MLSRSSPGAHSWWAALALLVLAAAPARANDWESLGLDGTHARVSLERTGVAFGPGWEHRLGAVADAVYLTLLASPALSDGYLVYGTYNNVVRGVQEVDGHTVWERKLDDAIYASPALWRGRAYVLGLDRHLYALRLTDGEVLWKKNLGGIGYASPTIVGTSLFVATGNPEPRLFRINAATGEVLWTSGAGVLKQAVHAPLAVGDGHVVVGETGGRYHAFSIEDGSLIWTVTTGGMVDHASALILGQRAYLLPGGDDARLHAVDLATGTPVEGWPLTIPVPDQGVEGVLLNRQYVVSSLTGLVDLIVFERRADERLDTNGDRLADTYLMREHTVGIDASKAQVRWSTPNGRVVATDPNRIPVFGFCPTPALYGPATAPQVIVASSLVPEVRVLGGGGGLQLWSRPISAPTRASPVLANGHLLVATNAGVVHSLLSDTNHPPVAPEQGFFPAGGQPVDRTSVILRWGAAADREGDPIRYQVRLDDDGEVLESWDLEVVTGAGPRELAVAEALEPDRTYTFSVRARDSRGAYAAWSRPEPFRAASPPPVEVDGTPAGNLEEAVASARGGQTIRLGAGVYPLSSNLRPAPDVSVIGAGPHLTTLTGKGLAVGLAVTGAGIAIGQLTVADAAVGIEVSGGGDAKLTNIILRDNDDAGLSVTATGRAELVSATVFRNGVGVRAGGPTEIRNALVTANTTGISAVEASLIQSHYNNVYGNRTQDYLNAERASTDMASEVTFVTVDGSDLRLQPIQPSTDRGDPTDDFTLEPQPNGDRINVGAFGNTPFAELSAEPEAMPDAGMPDGGMPDGGANDPDAGDGGGPPAHGKGTPSGCGCRLAAGQDGQGVAGLPLVLGTAWLVLRRRRRAR